MKEEYLVSLLSSSFPFYFKKINKSLVDSEMKHISNGKKDEDIVTIELKECPMEDIYSPFWFLGTLIPAIVLLVLVVSYFAFGMVSWQDQFASVVVMLVTFGVIYYSVSVNKSENQTSKEMLYFFGAISFPAMMYSFFSWSPGLFLVAFLASVNIITFIEVGHPLLRAIISPDTKFYIYGDEIKFILIKRIIHE